MADIQRRIIRLKGLQKENYAVEESADGNRWITLQTFTSRGDARAYYDFLKHGGNL